MNLRVLVVLIAIAAVMTFAFACSRSTRTAVSSDVDRNNAAVLTKAGVAVEVFGEDGYPSPKDAANYLLNVTNTKNGRLIEVALSSENYINASYLKIYFNGNTEHASDFMLDSDFSNACLVYSGQTKQGEAICAQVLPNGKRMKVSGSILKVKLENGADSFKTNSAFNDQKDLLNPILAEAAVDTVDASKITFKVKLKGEANVNNIFDFADFGSVGVYYNKTVAATPNVEPADGSANGKVDFADFGVIGANYNKGVAGFQVYRDDSNPPTTASTKIGMTSKVTGDQTIDYKTVAQGADGFRKYTIDPKGSGSFAQIVLINAAGTEDKTYVSDIISLAPPSKTINGTVKSQKNLPMADVTMTLRNLDKSTNQIQKTTASGTFSFSNLIVGTNYQLTPTKIGYSFSPTKFVFVGSDDVITQNFVGILPISESDLNSLRIEFVKRPTDTEEPTGKTNWPVLITKRTANDTDKTNDEPWAYPAVWVKAMGKTSTSPTKEVNVSKYVIFNLTNNSSFGRIDGFVDTQGLADDDADDAMAISGVSAGDFEVTAMSDGLSKITTPLTVNSFTILNIVITGKDGDKDFNIAKSEQVPFSATGVADNDNMFGTDPTDTTPPFNVPNIESTIYWLIEGAGSSSFSLSNNGNLTALGTAKSGDKVAVFSSLPLPLIFGTWEFPITSNTIWVTVQ